MHIPGATQIATDHILEATKRLAENARSVARTPVVSESQPVETHNKSLEEVVVDNLQIRYEVKASSLVIKTADEMLGILLDTKA